MTDKRDDELDTNPDPGVKRSLERRLARLEERLKSVRPPMQSETSLSVRPTGFRLTLRNPTVWVVIIAGLALVWALRGG